MKWYIYLILSFVIIFVGGTIGANLLCNLWGGLFLK